MNARRRLYWPVRFSMRSGKHGFLLVVVAAAVAVISACGGDDDDDTGSGGSSGSLSLGGTVSTGGSTVTAGKTSTSAGEPSDSGGEPSGTSGTASGGKTTGGTTSGGATTGGNTFYLPCESLMDCDQFGGGKVCCVMGTMHFCTKPSACKGDTLP